MAERDTAPEEVLDGDSMPSDVEMEAPFGTSDEITPIVRVCPDCTEEQIVVTERDRPPATYGEATAIVRCCGSQDEWEWRWCRRFFAVTKPRDCMRISFDRRKGVLR